MAHYKTYMTEVWNIILLLIFKGFIIHKLKKLAKKTKTELDDILIHSINDIHWPFYVFLSLFISIKFVTVPELVEKSLNYIIIILVAFYAVKFAQSMLNFSAEKIYVYFSKSRVKKGIS